LQTVDVETVPWADHFRTLSWKQGEHVTILGPTGSGKTTLALELLAKRSYVLALATKPKDPALAALRSDGYNVTRSWPPDFITDRIIVWPKMDQADAREAEYHLADVHARTLSAAYLSGGWCVYVDELIELSDLGLKPEINRILRQGRSQRVSFVGGSQRPFEVPQSVYSQATHFYFFQTADDRDLKRLSEISGRVDKRALRDVVASLDWHDVVYANARDGRMEVTRVER